MRSLKLKPYNVNMRSNIYTVLARALAALRDAELLKHSAIHRQLTELCPTPRVHTPNLRAHPESQAHTPCSPLALRQKHFNDMESH